MHHDVCPAIMLLVHCLMPCTVPTQLSCQPLIWVDLLWCGMSCFINLWGTERIFFFFVIKHFSCIRACLLAVCQARGRCIKVGFLTQMTLVVAVQPPASGPHHNVSPNSLFGFCRILLLLYSWVGQLLPQHPLNLLFQNFTFINRK